MQNPVGKRVTALPADHPLSTFKMISLDYSARTASFLMRDGELHVGRLPPSREETTATRLTFFPNESVVEVKASGRTVNLDIGRVTDVADRSIVYLDQNHWVDYTKYRLAPSMLEPQKVDFYHLLDALVSDRRVILPISAGHLVEASRRGGPSRLDLGETMLERSRGWQLLDPLSLRRAELRALFGGELLVRVEAVTLAPHALFNVPMETPHFEAPYPALDGLMERLTWAGTLATLLLDTEPLGASVEDVPAKWAQSFTPLAQELRTNTKARGRARTATLLRFIVDMLKDLAGASAESGMTPQRFADWVENEADTAFSALPGVARQREVMHLRLMNADDRWEANDLNDWFYLSFAAGYCDLVLGERKTTNLLKRVAGKVPAGAKLHSRAVDAVPDLRTLAEGPGTQVL